MAVSFVKGSFIWGIILMVVYALGYGLTFTAIIIGIGLGFGKTSRTFTKIGNALKYTSGIIMIAVGFYLLITL
jgi:cytochrome c biogenesis protein CcdA